MVSSVLEAHKLSASGGKSFAFRSAVLLTAGFVVYGVVCLLADQIVDYVEESSNSTDDLGQYAPESGVKFGNPLYTPNKLFRLYRRYELLGMTQREADFGRRMVASLVLGTLIGVERRAPNRAAGVRTMALISLGACLFTICSAYAFEAGSQAWDASRISAALPSGVGFLGGAVIFKDKADVVGLTTATGIWAACAVGTACGGAMYFVAAFATAGMVAMLRFGPRNAQHTEESGQPENDAPAPQSDPFSVPLLGGNADAPKQSQNAPTRRLTFHAD